MMTSRTSKSITDYPSASSTGRAYRRVNISGSKLAAFCHRHHMKSLALFGSVLRDGFKPDSDIDVLVEFESGKTPGFLELADMESELSALFENRKVDLRTPQDLSHHFRDRVVREAEVLCR